MFRCWPILPELLQAKSDFPDLSDFPDAQRKSFQIQQQLPVCQLTNSINDIERKSD